MINIEKILDIMIEYKMKSLDEFVIAYTCFTKDLKSLHRYIDNRIECLEENENGEMTIQRHFSIDLIESMADRGILDKSQLNFNNNKIDFLDLYVTDEFADKFFIESGQAGEELWDAYPNSTYINGAYVILKKGEKIGNVYYDKDKLIEIYCKKINHSKDKHKEIISKTIKAKEAGILNFTLRSYILDELYLHLDIPSETYNNKTII